MAEKQIRQVCDGYGGGEETRVTVTGAVALYVACCWPRAEARAGVL